MKLSDMGIGIIVLISVFLAIVLVGLFVGKGCATKLLPPIPTVVSSRTNSDHSKFTDYCATIIADIRNDGGNGDVVVTVFYTEGTKSWTKSSRQGFTANETKSVSIDFPEATLGGGGRYEITAR